MVRENAYPDRHGKKKRKNEKRKTNSWDRPRILTAQTFVAPQATADARIPTAATRTAIYHVAFVLLRYSQ